jgi:hypothetical protein
MQVYFAWFSPRPQPLGQPTPAVSHLC